MSRRQWVWVVLLGCALVYLLAACKLAYDANALGAGTTGFLRAVMWALTVLAPLASVFGILGAIKQSSTAAAFRTINSLAGRVVILAVSAGLGTVLLVAATRTKPEADWSCKIASTRTLPPEPARCGIGSFERMKVFELQLDRATPPSAQPTVLATATDREHASATLLSERCGGNGPDFPLRGQSELALGPRCGEDQHYPIEVAVCGAASIRLRAAAKLVMAEGNNTTSLDCVGDDSGSDVPRDAGADAAPAPDAGPVACPDPSEPLALGHAWLYVRAWSKGSPLGWESNHAELHTRRASSDPLPGDPGNADDPCLVASYATSDDKTFLFVSADHFVPQAIEVSPVTCTRSRPCPVELPARLDAAYYVASATGIHVKTEAQVTTDHAAFEAAVAADALASSKELHRSFGEELARVAKATNVPARNLAIRYSESQLHKKCDARCLGDAKLDPAIREYLGRAIGPGGRNPFEPE